VSNGNHDNSGEQADHATPEQRVGIRRTVIVIVIFVVLVFSWSIIGRFIK